MFLCAFRDGLTQSGLFVTVSCIWERLKDEHEVDVFQTVKQLRFHRPELVVNLVSGVVVVLHLYYLYCKSIRYSLQNYGKLQICA